MLSHIGMDDTTAGIRLGAFLTLLPPTRCFRIGLQWPNKDREGHEGYPGL